MTRRHMALVVDNDADVLEVVQEIVGSLGHTSRCASNQKEAEVLLAERSFCYVLLDLELPLHDRAMARLQTGFNILQAIRQEHPKSALPVIVMTGHGEGHELPVRALQLEATDFVKKPFDDDFEPLEDKIRKAVAKTCEAQHERCPNAGSPRTRKKKKKKKKKRKNQVAYRTDHTLHFDGECRRRRYRMAINDEEVWVKGGTFELLWKLAVGVLNDGPDWVRGRELHPNYHNALSRMKQDVADVAGLDARFLENDGHGSYRLSIPPENLTYDGPGMRANFPGEFALLS